MVAQMPGAEGAAGGGFPPGRPVPWPKKIKNVRDAFRFINEKLIPHIQKLCIFAACQAIQNIMYMIINQTIAAYNADLSQLKS